MRVLVTGAKGQVGSELILEGEKRRMHMLAARRAELDITQQDAVNSFIQTHKPDILINAAAYTAVDKAESEPKLAYAINRDGAANLAQACADNNIPLMHISTDYVFDGKKEGAYTETARRSLRDALYIPTLPAIRSNAGVTFSMATCV